MRVVQSRKIFWEAVVVKVAAGGVYKGDVLGKEQQRKKAKSFALISVL
jgi:hypothetical protein